MERPKVPTLPYLYENKMPIFVLNKTPIRSDVLLTVIQQGQKPRVLRIPRTWIPINLTEYTTAEALVNCHDLINLIRKRALRLIWPEQANDLLAEDEAQDELRRLGQTQSMPWTGDEVTEEVASVMEQFNTGPVDTTPQISPIVINVIEQWQRNDLPLKQLYGEVRTMEDELTQQDLSYVISQVPDGKIKDWCRKKLADVQANPPQARPASVATSGNQVYDVRDDSTAGMTQEEIELEERRAAQARAEQLGGDKAARDIALERLRKRMGETSSVE